MQIIQLQENGWSVGLPDSPKTYSKDGNGKRCKGLFGVMHTSQPVWREPEGLLMQIFAVLRFKLPTQFFVCPSLLFLKFI